MRTPPIFRGAALLMIRGSEMTRGSVALLHGEAAPARSSGRLANRLLSMAATDGAGLLKAGDSRRIGGCEVYRQGDRLFLERAAEPGNVQSEWDIATGTAPDYAGTMADMARSVLDETPGGRRVLMLGMGGGTIAGQLLCGSGAGTGFSTDWALHITAIEADPDVTAAAHSFYFPVMFGHCREAKNMRSRIKVVHADAFAVANGSVVLKEAAGASFCGPFDVIIEDFGYPSYGRLTMPFWRSLRAFAAPEGTILINTLYEHASELAMLERDLRAAGWRRLRRRVDRGMQAEPGACKSPRAEDWQPGDNLIFSAVNAD